MKTRVLLFPIFAIALAAFAADLPVVPEEPIAKKKELCNEIMEMAKDPARKEERNKRLVGRSATFPVEVAPEAWHDVVLETVGDSMRATLDCKAVGFLKSSGIAHPTKSKIEFGSQGQDGYFKDIKIWNAEAAK